MIMPVFCIQLKTPPHDWQRHMSNAQTSSHAAPLKLCLASASPRRLELLAQVGLQVQVLPQNIDESVLGGEAAADYVVRLARLKAGSAMTSVDYDASMPVLAADTAVVCDDVVLGKPGCADEARRMLRLLSGRAHQVLTAVAVADPQRMAVELVRTTVFFRELSDAEISAYWESGEPQDKAGAYAIQGLGAMFISRIEGSYSAVVGLPLFESLQLLAGFSLSTTALLRGSAA